MRWSITFIGTLVMYGCSNGLELGGSSMFRFCANGDAYFPNEFYSNVDSTKGEFFNSELYAKLLHQLHEPSLSHEFSGVETIRLTVKRTFEPHFMIKIEKRDDGRFMLTEKEVWRDKGFTVDSANYMLSSHIQFDSTENRFYKVKVSYRNPPVEIQREEIDPVAKSFEKALTEEQWNNLITLLNNGLYYSMGPQVKELGFDGNWYLVETHSKSGYYLVDRWNPGKGDFTRIVDYVVDLAGRPAEN